MTSWRAESRIDCGLLQCVSLSLWTRPEASHRIIRSAGGQARPRMIIGRALARLPPFLSQGLYPSSNRPLSLYRVQLSPRRRRCRRRRRRLTLSHPYNNYSQCHRLHVIVVTTLSIVIGYLHLTYSPAVPLRLSVLHSTTTSARSSNTLQLGAPRSSTPTLLPLPLATGLPHTAATTPNSLTRPTNQPASSTNPDQSYRSSSLCSLPLLRPYTTLST